MEYGKIVNRSVNIVWQNKFLIVLGFLASLGGGTTSSFGRGGDGNGNGGLFAEPGRLSDVEGEILGLALGLFIGLLCVALVIGIALWIVSTIARGGTIAGVDAIETGEKSSFSQAWSAGWRRAGALLGIGILPALPGLILFVVGLLALGAYGGFFALFGGEFADGVGAAGVGISLVVLVCIVAPIVIVLSILRNFAERACMLEGLGVLDSYRRGWNVLTANLGEAIVLFLLQIAIFIVLGILLFVPGIIVAICCFLWPLALVAQGAASAFVSSLWTLAWREWTGRTTMVEKAPATI